MHFCVAQLARGSFHTLLVSVDGRITMIRFMAFVSGFLLSTRVRFVAFESGVCLSSRYFCLVAYVEELCIFFRLLSLRSVLECAMTHLSLFCKNCTLSGKLHCGFGSFLIQEWAVFALYSLQVCSDLKPILQGALTVACSLQSMVLLQ